MQGDPGMMFVGPQVGRFDSAFLREEEIALLHQSRCVQTGSELLQTLTTISTLRRNVRAKEKREFRLASALCEIATMERRGKAGRAVTRAKAALA